MTNPFEELHNEIKGVSLLVQTLIDKQQDDLVSKFYTRQEAAEILRVDVQTIDNRIDSGTIKAFKSETNKRSKILIPHSELFNSLNEVKSIKYKR